MSGALGRRAASRKVVPVPLTKLWPLLSAVLWPIAPPSQPAAVSTMAAVATSVAAARRIIRPARAAGRRIRGGIGHRGHAHRAGTRDTAGGTQRDLLQAVVPRSIVP